MNEPSRDFNPQSQIPAYALRASAGRRTPQSNQDLPRTLSLLDATMINIGSMIGSGIFIVPAAIALQLNSTPLVILVWTIGGIISLFGALSVAELGAMFPRAGGQYVYLSEAYHPLAGFLYGWAGFVVITSASISAVAVGFAQYLGYFFPLDDGGVKAIAIVSILFLTAINCVGTKVGAAVQNAFTFLKIAALAGIVLLGVAAGSFDNFSPMVSEPTNESVLTLLGLAMIGVLWSYDGWIEITYVAGEVKNPERNIHRSLFYSTVVVIAAYVLVNIALIALLGFGAMSRSQLVAADAATASLGAMGGVLVTIAVIVSTFGANNGFVFTGARIYYAMAREGLFFKSLANIHPRFQTPVPSLAAQGVWSCLLVLSGTYDQLITYIVFASFLFYAMSCSAVIVLRKRSPKVHRPYNVWGYPFTPLLFILFSLALVIQTILENPRDAAIGVLMIASGVPAFWWWEKRRKTKAKRG